jgi:Zn-dependent M28 family amino/carboxypeptidase
MLKSILLSLYLVLDPGSRPHELVMQERLVGWVEMLPTKRAVRADAEHLEGLYKTQELLIGQLKELGYEPQTQEVGCLGCPRDPQRPLVNIIVEISAPPHAPAAGENGIADAGKSPPEILIVGAHFDAVPNSPGADDDGTGVAAIMEMARVFKDRPMRRTVRLCLFNIEEAGIWGSAAYAEEVGKRIEEGKEKVIGMIALDMLGYYSDEPDSQKSPLGEIEGLKQPTVADFIAIATILKHRWLSQALDKGMREAVPEARTFVLDILPLPIPDLLRSDHAPFMGKGIPALIVSDTANFRSSHYHQPTDTIATLDRKRFTATVRALVAGVEAIAEGKAESATGNDER